MKAITNYKLSRTHSGGTNYLLITQSRVVKFDYKNAVEYNPVDKKMTVLPEYQVNDIKDNSETAEASLLKYLETDAMSKENVATKDYSYFKVVLADGREIICTNYKDFLNYYKK